MLNCDHQCCSECAKNYFSVCFRDKTIADANCPFCSEPKGLGDNANEDMASEYFAKLVRNCRSIVVLLSSLSLMIIILF